MSPRNRNWRTWRPNSLQEAVEACLAYAQQHNRASVERVADLVDESKWTLYKWIESGNIPSRKIQGFEHACGAHFVTQYLASAAHKLVIDIPVGRRVGATEIHSVQESCTAAVGALLAFAQGSRSADDTIAALTQAMEGLAYERGQVERAAQPELSLG